MNKGYLSRKRKRSNYNYITTKKTYVSKIPRSVKGNDVKFRTEQFSGVYYPNGLSTYSFTSATTAAVTFTNVSAIIAASPSYTKYNTLYGKMKIKGYQVTFTSARGLNTNSHIDYVLAFFPNIKGQASSSDVIGHDISYHVPITSDRMYKYNYYFSKNTYSGPEGTGYGVWFNPAKLSSLDGQFSLQPIGPIGNSGGTITLGFIRFVFYIAFSDPIF